MTDEEVTKALTVIDKATTDQPTMSGPFSVFHVEPEHNQPASQSSPGLLTAEEVPPVQACNNPNWMQDFVPRQEHQPFSNRDGSQWRQSPLRGGLAMISGEGLSANLTEINTNSEEQDVPEQPTEDSDPKIDIDLLDEVILDASNGFSSGWDIINHSDANQQRDHAILEIESPIPIQRNWLTIQNPRPRETELSFSHLSHSLGSTIKNTSTTMLIHHYTHNIVHLMQPVSHRGNPFQTLYLPLAIEGSTATEVDQNSRGISPATVAVFHSLLCSAATNLQGLGSGESGLQQLAFRHKERALNALRSSLARKVGRYKDLMVAILSLVSADVSLRLYEIVADSNSRSF